MLFRNTHNVARHIEKLNRVPYSVFTPIPRYKYKKHRFSFYIVDLVEENVRNRCIFPIVALIIFILLIIATNVVDINIGIQPMKVQLSLPLNTNYMLTTNFNETFPSVRIKVSSDVQSLDNYNL